MNIQHWATVICLLLGVGGTQAEFDCVCSVAALQPVYSEPGTWGDIIGALPPHTCKQLVVMATDRDWLPIAYLHKVGYIQVEPDQQKQTCADSPDVKDALSVDATSPPDDRNPTAHAQGSTSHGITTTASLTTTADTSTSTSSSSTSQLTSPSTSTANRHTTIISGELSLCPQALLHTHTHGYISQYGSSCYEVVTYRHIWSHAKSICRQRGGNLLHIANEGEQLFVYNLLVRLHYNHSVWTGLNDLRHEERFEWSSGDPVTYTNWRPGRKDNYYRHIRENCVLILPFHRGQWDDVPCGTTSLFGGESGQTASFICQYGTIARVTTPANSASLATSYVSGNTALCNRRLHHYAINDGGELGQFGPSCYEVIFTKVSWSQSEKSCHARGGHLASIANQEEQAYLQTFLLRVDPKYAVWIGLHDQNHEERFEWVSGEPVNYINWLPGRKDNYESHTTEDCVAFIPYKGGKWDDTPCGSSFLGLAVGERHYTLCQFRIIPVDESSIIG